MVSAEGLRNIADQQMGEGGLFVYNLDGMADTARDLQAVEMPYGMTVRYAAKANPDPTIVSNFDRLGLSFEASSAPEAVHLINTGVEGSKISLSPQVMRDNADLRHALDMGVRPVATALDYIGLLARTGADFGLDTIAIRANAGFTSGGDDRTKVAGPAAPFGIWKDQMPQALAEAQAHGLTVDRIHTHIGSGVDPAVWREAIQHSLAIVEQFPDVTTLDMGGGYKVARMPGEQPTDMDKVFDVFAEELELFTERTGRELHLEIEPGTLLVANHGVLLGRVEVLTNTPGYNQGRLNVGMNAILRISRYGAQHYMEALNDSIKTKKYALFGPVCEIDLLTPVKDDPKRIEPRELRELSADDFIAIYGAGAYSEYMSTVEYNHVYKPTKTFVGKPLQPVAA